MKNTSNIPTRILFVLIIIFICLYSIGRNGYVSKIHYDKTLQTEEQIKEFESNIDKNKETVSNYHENNRNYRNIFSDTLLYISNLISNASYKLLDIFDDIINYLFN